MRDDQMHPGVGDHPGQIRVGDPGGVVDNVGAGGNGRLGDPRLESVGGDDRIGSLADGPDDRDHPFGLFLPVKFRPRSKRHPADIQPLRSSVNGSQRRIDSGVEGKGRPAVVETIGGPVDDRHHRDLLRKVDSTMREVVDWMNEMG